MVRGPVAGLSMAETCPNLIQRRVAMVAQRVCKTVQSRPCNIVVTNWSNAPIKLSKNMLVALCTPASGTVWPSLNEGDVINVTQLCKESESKEHKLERDFAVVYEDAMRSGSHQTEQVMSGEKYSAWRLMVMKMIKKYQSMWDESLKKIFDGKHPINPTPPDAGSIYAALCRADPLHPNMKKDEVDQMTKAGVAEKGTIECSSQIDFVPTKDVCLRFCINYRRLNTVTIRDSHQIPRMDECIDSLRGVHYFAAMDGNTEYFQLGMDPRDVDNTAFVTHHELSHYISMPFGLKNDSATFQRAMYVILASVE